MSRDDEVAAVATFLRNHKITRCPTVCVVPTRTNVSEADRAAYRAYLAAKEDARQRRLRSIQRLLQF